MIVVRRCNCAWDGGDVSVCVRLFVCALRFISNRLEKYSESPNFEDPCVTLLVFCLWISGSCSH